VLAVTLPIVKTIISLGIGAAFLAGVSLALLVSYALVPNTSMFVCFVALFIALAALLLGGWAIVLDATRRERLTVERIIDLTVDQLLRRRGLKVVDDR
jgi:hypothetical protein